MPAADKPVPIDEPPARRIAIAVERFGEREVADRAVGLLTGSNEGEEFLLFVGGRHAQGILGGAPALYWPEVWGARALMYAWHDSAASAVRDGLANRAWRVREMCAKVVALRELGLAEAVVGLVDDEVPRVRAQAARALGRVGEFEHADILKNLLKDADLDVRRQAGAALRELATRLDRSLED